ncbi:MAG: lipoate--protein ligase family protein [Planctomycetota bacterium]
MLCHLIVDSPADGAWNMAVDESMLDWAAAENQLVWRFYRWSEPTLSLGYFQSAAAREAHPASQRCPMVRRLTGGGAILHDRELTYSVVVPARHPLSDRDRLYGLAHKSLIEALRHWGVHAAQHEVESKPVGPDPFLCFERRAAGDVVWREWKIAGSAQRRRRGAVLQHGSVLLERSSAAPELPGLNDLTDRPVNAEELIIVWWAAVQQLAGLTAGHHGLPGEIRLAAEEITQLRYANPVWTSERQVSRGNFGAESAGQTFDGR